MRLTSTTSVRGQLLKSFVADAHHIRPLGDRHHSGVAFQQLVDRFLHIIYLGGPGLLQSGLGKARRIDINLTGMIQGLINALGAPLVNDEILGITVTVKKLLRAADGSHDTAEFRTSQTLTAFARHHDRSSLFENITGRDHGLADSIKGRIQGIPATGGNYHIHPLVHRDRAMVVNHFATGQMGMVVVPGKNTGNRPLFIDHHVENEIGTRQLRYPKAVLVEGVAFQKTVSHLGMVDYFKRVHELHGFITGDPRQQRLAPAGIAGVEMGFDK